MGEYIPEMEGDTLMPLAFGKQMRERAFLFQPGWRNLNHGSYGAHPLHVRTAQRKFQEDADQFPDEWIYRLYPQLSQTSRGAAAALLHAPVETIVLVPNATTGTNTVLRNLVFEKGDRIICFSSTYDALVKTIDYITATSPAEKVTVEISYPISDDELLHRFKAKIDEVRESGARPRIAIFDTIVSIPGVRMPFERLGNICKEEGVMSCLDGAHGIGCIEINLTELDPDFFVTNCHKWLHTSRSVAVFYVPVRNQHLIRSTLPTSHGFLPVESSLSSSMSHFESQFENFGTLDMSPYLCIPAALQFRREVCGGEARVMQYCHTVMRAGAAKMVQILGPDSCVMENAEGTLGKDIPMANVKLPMRPILDSKERFLMLGWLWSRFVEEKKTRMFVYWYEGAFWVRMSGQIYLELQDFEWAGLVLKELCERADDGEYRGKAKKL